MIAFTVPGQPVPKGRARASIRGKGARAHVHHYTPDRTVEYETRVAWAARGACGSKQVDERDGEWCPVAVDIVAVLHRVGGCDKPKKANKPPGRQWAHGSTADADNIAKAVLDGMQRGGALANDRHVVDVRCRMVYAATGEAAHTEVRVWAVEGTP